VIELAGEGAMDIWYAFMNEMELLKHQLMQEKK
jgi:hypothetical protein